MTTVVGRVARRKCFIKNSMFTGELQLMESRERGYSGISPPPWCHRFPYFTLTDEPEYSYVMRLVTLTGFPSTMVGGNRESQAAILEGP